MATQIENQGQRIQVNKQRLPSGKATALQPVSTKPLYPKQNQYNTLHFDCRLNWKEHITKKRKQIDLKEKEVNWLLGKNPIYP